MQLITDVVFNNHSTPDGSILQNKKSTLSNYKRDILKSKAFFQDYPFNRHEFTTDLECSIETKKNRPETQGLSYKAYLNQYE